MGNLALGVIKAWPDKYWDGSRSFHGRVKRARIRSDKDMGGQALKLIYDGSWRLEVVTEGHKEDGHGGRSQT
jgi:hypothetical protein